MAKNNNAYTFGQNADKAKVSSGPGGGPRGGPPGSGGSGEKPKNFKESFSKLIAYCKNHMAMIVIAMVFVVGGTILTLIGPDKLSEITNLISEGLLLGSIDLSAIATIGISLAIMYGVSAILSYIQSRMMASSTQKISKQLRTDISKKINTLPVSYFHKTTTGDVLSIVTNDVDTISQALNQSVGTLISAIALLLGSIIMMLATNVVMTVTAVVSSLVGFALMMFIMSKSQKYFSRQQKYLGQMNGHIEETYAGHTIVKAYNAEAETQEEFDTINTKLKDSAYRSQTLSGFMMPLMSFIGNFGYVAVCVVGAILAFNGTISFGTIIAFTLYVRYFTQPLSQIAQAFQTLQSAAAASERVFDFLDEEDMTEESGKTLQLEQVKGKVEFKNVAFSYEDSEQMVIHDFSAIAQPGQKVAIVGPTGAGKTTMVNLLMRFHEIQSGEILIDDVPISNMTREEVHGMFCMVLQDTWLFEGTIRENIVYCMEGVSDEEVIEASKAVGLHHFVRTLPKGYDTVLNDKVNLSAGQKQQLTIARAMIKNAPMLILDEATSSVDTRTELQIQNAMDTLMEGRTSFVISHRLSTIRNADVILVMKDGDIIESGTHDELLAKNGFYADLYNSQFEQAA